MYILDCESWCTRSQNYRLEMSGVQNLAFDPNEQSDKVSMILKVLLSLNESITEILNSVYTTTIKKYALLWYI